MLRGALYTGLYAHFWLPVDMVELVNLNLNHLDLLWCHILYQAGIETVELQPPHLMDVMQGTMRLDAYEIIITNFVVVLEKSALS